MFQVELELLLVQPRLDLPEVVVEGPPGAVLGDHVEDALRCEGRHISDNVLVSLLTQVLQNALFAAKVLQFFGISLGKVDFFNC